MTFGGKWELRAALWELAATAAILLCAGRETRADDLGSVVITATRIAEPPGPIPADISVVTGAELRSRSDSGMASALQLVAGVEAPAGGDAGPSSAVPSFWGLHEFDAFLLVVDGVPWGGAFNPSITTLDLTDVARVEVQKGAAPVMYGATSFVGVVQAIHYPAGEAANDAELAYGSRGSVKGSASLVLPPAGTIRQSLAVEGQKLGFADPRESVADGKLLYRGAIELGGGTLGFDANVAIVHDVPPSPVLRVGTLLSSATPINANFNPRDARIDENRYQLAIGYSKPTSSGSWDTLASYAYSDVSDIRAFLHPDLSGAADTQNQRRSIDDAYIDTHLSFNPSVGTTVVIGNDILIGLGRQTTRNGNSAYTVPLDGSQLPPAASALPVDEIGTLSDHRLFVGQYGQAEWKLDKRCNFLAGIRLNETYEHKDSSDLTLDPTQFDAESQSKTVIRPSETLGASYGAWSAGSDEVTVYADLRNAFKPAAIDFGPDYTPDLLRPETAQSYEAGIRGKALDGRLSFEAETFLMYFNNLVVATSGGALANAGGERLKGVELESRYEWNRNLSLTANVSYHDARFTQYLLSDGDSSIDVAGRQLPLSPHLLAAMGLLYTPTEGLGLSVIANYIGRRFLDEENSAPVGGYMRLDGVVSYSSGKVSVKVDGSNLTNRRPPVSASEFGSESFYLLPARVVWLRVGWRLQ